MQKWSLPLGVASFGGYVLIMATTSGYKDQAAVYFLVFAFGAGLFQANATRFFAGLALFLVCGAAYMAYGATEHERSYIGIVIELLFALIIVLAAIPFFAGYVLRRIFKAFKARKIVE